MGLIPPGADTGTSKEHAIGAICFLMTVWVMGVLCFVFTPDPGKQSAFWTLSMPTLQFLLISGVLAAVILSFILIRVAQEISREPMAPPWYLEKTIEAWHKEKGLDYPRMAKGVKDE